MPEYEILNEDGFPVGSAPANRTEITERIGLLGSTADELAGELINTTQGPEKE